MTQHYPRNTVWATSWCAKCHGLTPHRIDNARVGPCMTCMERLEKEHAERQAPGEAAQGNLFGGGR